MEEEREERGGIEEVARLAWYQADEGLMSMGASRVLDADCISARVTVLCDPRLSCKAIIRDLIRIARALDERHDFYVADAASPEMCVIEG